MKTIFSLIFTAFAMVFHYFSNLFSLFGTKGLNYCKGSEVVCFICLAIAMVLGGISLYEHLQKTGTIVDEETEENQ